MGRTALDQQQLVLPSLHCLVCDVQRLISVAATVETAVSARSHLQVPSLSIHVPLRASLHYHRGRAVPMVASQRVPLVAGSTPGKQFSNGELVLFDFLLDGRISSRRLT